MGILDGYEQEDGLSLCICLLHNSKKEEEQLFEIQREMSESLLTIRQSYVFGDQTVNALEFSRFYPGYYTKAEKDCSYPAHEALVLAAGMMRKEIDQMKKSGAKENWKYLLLIIGEDFAKKQEENRTAYQMVKQWVMDQKDWFDTKIID